MVRYLRLARAFGVFFAEAEEGEDEDDEDEREGPKGNAYFCAD